MMHFSPRDNRRQNVYNVWLIFEINCMMTRHTFHFWIHKFALCYPVCGVNNLTQHDVNKGDGGKRKIHRCFYLS
jgi:hypothetical protein